MSINEKPVLGIILGDHAGSSPEMAAKAVLAGTGSYIPVFTGNLERFKISCKNVEGAERICISTCRQIVMGKFWASRTLVPYCVRKYFG